MKKTLYKLITQGLGEFYVIEDDPTKAQTKLYQQLAEQDYGLTDKRKVNTIEVVAEQNLDSSGGIWFSGGGKLILGLIVILFVACTSSQPVTKAPDWNHQRYERKTDNLKH